MAIVATLASSARRTLYRPLMTALTATLAFGTFPATAGATGQPASGSAFNQALLAPEHAAPATADAGIAAGTLPLAFVPNQGQFNTATRFVAQGRGGAISFAQVAVSLALHDGQQLRLAFDGANASPSIEPLRQLPGVANYALGDDPGAWHEGIATYRDILYRQLYSGVDLHYTGSDGLLKSTYFVAAGSDPAQIRLRYNASSLSIDADGSLLLGLPRTSATAAPSVIREQAPVAWQQIGSRRVPVAASYLLHSDGTVGFVLGAYDQRSTLVIDPALLYGTYLGGTNADDAFGVAVGSDGSIFLTGETSSDPFPGSIVASPGVADAFVTKLAADGASIAYTTYLGGSATDTGYDLAVNAAGEAYVTGKTNSANFPVVAPGINTQPVNPGVDKEVFVTKLGTSGTVQFSTLLGGDGDDTGYGIDVVQEAGGTVRTYIAGQTASTMPFATLGSISGGSDAFVAEIVESGGSTSLTFFRYLGGSNNESARGVAADASGAYLTGDTASTGFPTTAGVLQGSKSTGSDAFVTKVSTTGAVLYSTFLGRTSSDVGYGIDVTSGGQAVVVGSTTSANFYTTGNAVQPTIQGNADIFVTRLAADGSAISYSTYLGGSAVDQANGVALDSANNIYVVGETASVDFDLLGNFATPTTGGNAFAAKITAAGDLDYSTLLGGSGNDRAAATAINPGDSSQFVVGSTTSSNILTTTTAFQPGLAGGSSTDAFVYQIGQPKLVISDSLVLEGTGPGSTTMPFTATLSISSTQNVTITFSTVDGSARADNDFTAATSSTLVIPAGSITGTITVPITRDATYEPDQQFSLNIGEALGAIFDGSTPPQGTILNDDALPQIALGSLTQAEGSGGGTTPFAVPLGISGTSELSITFSYTTTDGTALAPADFVAASGTLATLPPFATSGALTITVAADDIYERDEAFALTIGQPGDASILTNTTTVTITNDDAAPVVEIGDLSQLEGTGGSTAFAFPVTVTGATALPLTFAYTTSNGSALAPGDFVPQTSALVTIPAGQATTGITISVVADTTFEADETFTLELGEPVDATLGDSLALGTIRNDDGAPGYTVSSVSLNEGNSGTTAFSFTVELTAVSGLAASFAYATADGTAIAGSDYEATLGTIIIPAGTLSTTVVVTATGDTLFEADETFTLAVTGTAGVQPLGTAASGSGTILNDDAAPELGLLDLTQAEGSGGGTTAFTLTVAVSGTSDLPITFAYTTTDGTATAPGDYTAAAGTTVTLPPLATAGSFALTIAADDVFELDEALGITIGSAIGATVITPTATVTITNDDTPPSISLLDLAQPEGSGGGSTPFALTVAVSGTSDLPITFAYTTTDGTATAPGDFAAVSNGTASIPAGAGTGSVTVTVVADNFFEGDETLSVELGNVVGATLGQGTAAVTITNDDTPPTASIADASVTEGNSGTTPITFVVSLNLTSTVDAVLSFATADGEAGAPGDYASATGMITIPAGELSRTLAISVSGDTLFEGDETFGLTLTPTSGVDASGGDLSATGTITNDDTPPGFTVGSISNPEGNSGTTPFVFTVSLTATSGITATVAYTTANGSASAPADYAAATGTLDILPGQTSGTITVDVVGDTTFEVDEDFTLLLGAASGVAGTTVATGTIQNDDTPPVVNIDDATVTEGDSGTTLANVTVSLTAPSGVTATVAYQTADQTALAGSDYTAATGVITFAPGVTSQTIGVLVTGDLDDEADEFFDLVLASPTGATIGDGTASVTITNDDDPTVAVSGGSAAEGDSGTTSLTVTVSLVGKGGVVSSTPVTVSYSTADGSATAGTDYEAATGTLVFMPGGGLSQTVLVSVTGDLLDEADETFSFALDSATGATVGTGSAAGTILDDDESPIAANDTFSTTEELTLTVPISGVLANDSDGDGDVLTAVLVNGPLSGTLTLNPDGSFDYTPALDVNGTDSFSYRASDGLNQSAVAIVTILISAVNDAPLALADTLTTTEDTALSIPGASLTANDTDVDGDSLSVVAVSASSSQSGTVALVGSTISYTPAANFSGSDTFTYTVSDGQGGNATAIVTVSVTPVNDAPLATADTLTTTEDTALSVAGASLTANDTDVDGGSLSVVAVSASSSQSGTVELVGSTVVYTPAANFNGSDTFSYTVSDGRGGSAAATVTVNVTPVNDAPLAVDDRLRVDVDSSGNLLAVLANDSDVEGDSLAVTAVSAATRGVVTIGAAGANLIYTPRAGFEGDEVFSYTVSDGRGGSSSATVRLRVGSYISFLPLIGAGMGGPGQPDLVAGLQVSPASPLAGEPALVTVVVTNTGTAAATNFWVDFYINPRRVPAVNDPWNEICSPATPSDPCVGVAWQITGTIEAGKSITLTSTISSYAASNTIWFGSFSPGPKRLYALVDSWNRAPNGGAREPEGAVVERDENNNLTTLLINVAPAAATSGEAPLPNGPAPASLPERSLATP